MVSSVLERELHQHLEHLPFGQQRQVLDFARALASSRAQGHAHKVLRARSCCNLLAQSIWKNSRPCLKRLQQIVRRLIHTSGKYLLDTNIVIALFASDSSVQSRLGQASEVLISSIVFGELYYGARKSGRVEANVRGQFSQWPVFSNFIRR
jgi:hypothetical protein